MNACRLVELAFGQLPSSRGGKGPKGRGSAGATNGDAPPNTLMPGSTRRQFVKRLSMASSVGLAKYRSIAFLPHLGFLPPAGFAETTLKPLFEEVPAAASGLTWR